MSILILNESIKKEENKNINLPLIVKHMPNHIDSILSQDHIVNNIKCFLKKKILPNMLFYGNPGTGKTSTVNALLDMIFGEDNHHLALELNSSNTRGIDTVRIEIKNYITYQNIFSNNNNYKFIILDEVDSATIDAQLLLRKIIEDNNNVSFCLICNEIQYVIPGLRSRCITYKFNHINESSIIKRIKYICEKENIIYDDDALTILAKKTNGDFRYALNLLQLITNNDKKKITVELVNKFTNISIITTAKKIVNNLDKYNICELYIYIKNILKDNNYEFLTLVNEITKLILLSNNNSNNIKDYLIETAKLDEKATDEYNERIHIPYYSSILYKWNKK